MPVAAGAAFFFAVALEDFFLAAFFVAFFAAFFFAAFFAMIQSLLQEKNRSFVSTAGWRTGLGVGLNESLLDSFPTCQPWQVVCGLSRRRLSLGF
jgi:hypothetical protein